MSLLEALVQYCVDAGVLVGDGIDSFRDFTPEMPDEVAVFHEYGGAPVSQFTTNLHRSVQVKVRAKDATAAKIKAWRLFSVLRPDSESLRVDFTDDLWGQVYIRQAPFKLSQDENDRVSYCFNLGITTNILE